MTTLAEQVAILNREKDTVLTLRRKGIKVRVTHERRFVYPQVKDTYLHHAKVDNILLWADRNAKYGNNFTFVEKVFPEMSATGGKTTVEITVDGKNYVGFALCSNKENYNKRRGVKIALSRALKQVKKG